MNHGANKEKEPTEKRVREWIQVSVNVILVIVGVIAVCIYGSQLKVMKGQLGEIVRQYPEIQKQAKAATDAVTQSARDSIDNAKRIERQLQIWQDQARAAQKQANIAQQAFDIQHRPWVGPGGQLTLTKAPTFQFTPPRTDWNKVHVTLDLEGVYVVKNFGTAPALNENSAISIEIPVMGDTTTRPNFKLIRCPDEDTASGRGEVIFPGTVIAAPFSNQTGSAFTPKGNKVEVRRIWVLGCITYHDVARKIHHTRFWLRSALPDNLLSDDTGWIDIGPNFRHKPILGFESWGEEAD